LRNGNTCHAEPANVPRKPRESARPKANGAPRHVLAIDIGGTSVKMLAVGESNVRKIRSGPTLTPNRMVERVKRLAKGWRYEAISIGYPGPVGSQGPRSEPGNLGPGWVGFDFAAAFGCPVRILNDAAMQSLGSYDGGRMLFLGLGTGLGSTLIFDHVVVPLELGVLPVEGGSTLGELLGRRGVKKLGKKAWRKLLADYVQRFTAAFGVDYIVLGGGNAKLVGKHPIPGTRLGHNLTAFRGGFRLWELRDIETLGLDEQRPTQRNRWRVL
jgi:polyphosphate glucokinase